MMNASETWKPIPGFPGYEASTKGRIRSTDRTLPDGRHASSKILTPRLSNRGYWQVNLRKDGKVKTVTVHRCGLLAHVGPPPPDRPFSRHFPDDNPDNNQLGNLSWCSQEVNEADKIDRKRRAGDVATPQERRDAETVAHRNAVTEEQPVIELDTAAGDREAAALAKALQDVSVGRWPRLRLLRAALRRWWDGA